MRSRTYAVPVKSGRAVLITLALEMYRQPIGVASCELAADFHAFRPGARSRCGRGRCPLEFAIAAAMLSRTLHAARTHAAPVSACVAWHEVGAR